MCVFFFKLKREVTLICESYADGILIVNLVKVRNDYLFYLALAGSNEPFRVTPFTSSG